MAGFESGTIIAPALGTSNVAHQAFAERYEPARRLKVHVKAIGATRRSVMCLSYSGVR